MGERYNGIVEVASSILAGSTKFNTKAFRPHRLEAQDTALSRRRRGFESPWGRQHQELVKEVPGLESNQGKCTLFVKAASKPPQGGFFVCAPELASIIRKLVAQHRHAEDRFLTSIAA